LFNLKLYDAWITRFSWFEELKLIIQIKDWKRTIYNLFFIQEFVDISKRKDVTPFPFPHRRRNSIFRIISINYVVSIVNLMDNFTFETKSTLFVCTSQTTLFNKSFLFTLLNLHLFEHFYHLRMQKWKNSKKQLKNNWWSNFCIFDLT
jgi:hypothetical protein